ncbi:MarR family winged helix-turn-helix transcriptional regulator [Altererythrobacter fulvus]|uniref:MarR family winged helix-turn-helix transcriptional regulator n=1 Tax=Caenibius fulvus TaxID=2126012 RepID=UPI0030160DEC
MTENDAGKLDDFDAWSDHYNQYYPGGSRLDQEFRTSRLLVLAARSWMYRIDNLLRQETGQSRARWQVLFAIAFAEQPATMSDIAHRARVQWPTLVRVVEGMERDGLIKREDNPADKRSKLLRLTPAGDDVVAHIQPTLDRERATLLSSLSDEELTQCTAMLQKVFEAAIR